MNFFGNENRIQSPWVILIVIALISGFGATLLNALFPEWRLIHYPLHAAVESVGAFAALIVALLILGLRNHGHLGTSYTWVASALIGMGFLDGLHALHHAGTNFIWLHSVATLIGGMTFMGVWLSDRFARFSFIQRLPQTVLGLAVFIGVGSIIFPQFIPAMMIDGAFNVWARTANIAGGVGFLIASAYFAIRDKQTANHGNRLVFSAHCFLFGISGVIFEFSVIWDATWWFWHILRICAYMIATFFYFNLARSIERELYILKQNLERTVKERTASWEKEMLLRQEAQTTLRKIGMAIDQSPILVFITDTAGVIEYVNPKFEQVTGYSREEAIGNTPRILKSPDTPRQTHEDMWKTILSGKVWTGEIKDRIKNGDVFWASAIISPIRNEQNAITHFVAMHEDITIRKLAEEAMAEARRAAEISNKAKTDLMANVSHELRTPLNAIIGFSETIKDAVFGPVGNDRYQQYGEYIHSSGRHLLELINDILDASAVDAGKLELHEEPVDIAAVCDVALRLVQHKARQGNVTLSRIENPDLPLLWADERRMKQIFLNLLSNAVKFTPPQGEVFCHAHIDDDASMTITVSDSGIGMDQEGLATALSKFGQVDSSLSRRHEGTGLGLPLTKGLVELHGGRMTLESQPGKGTIITLSFPPERVIPPV
ncbi:MAG: ATP-binding protein [Rhodospirillales bacterium]|nr:ATP-binding protein [Rhodospirillales bacterium]